MEKTRLALDHIGKLAFAQSSEILNPHINKGLPPSLAATDPSLNYHAKGLDVVMAAYVTELGYLANPAGTHSQAAEMHNESVKYAHFCLTWLFFNFILQISLWLYFLRALRYPL